MPADNPRSRRSAGRCLASIAWVLAGVVMAGRSHAAASDVPSIEAGQVVQIDTGTLRGLSTPDYNAHLGIPYAEPPIGALRWAPPRPARSWSGERDATHMATPCAQPRSSTSYAIHDSKEDCLYLNVYTPTSIKADAALPVIVWVHGGANVTGSASEYPAGGLAQVGRVVVVTLNYRLGLFGYLALPGLQAEDARLNFGLQDQLLALQWVQRNIRQFGGDPTRVTLAGESAGGGNAMALWASPLSTGLFHRLMVQSAAATGLLGLPAGLQQGLAAGQAFALQAGCAAGPDPALQVACLRAQSTQALLAASPYDESFAQPSGLWGPVLDGHLYPAPIADQVKAGVVAKVPVLTGVTHDEFRLLSVLAFEAKTGQSPTDADRIAAFAKLSTPQASKLLNGLYPARKYGSPGNALGALLTDFLLACPTDQFAKLIAGRMPVYTYQFNDPHAPNILAIQNIDMGAYHASELQYLFDQPTTSQLDAQQQVLARQMKQYWAHFAATGNPNSAEGGQGSDLPNWPRFNSLVAPYRDLRPGGPAGVLSLGAFYFQHLCGMWGLIDSLIPPPTAP